MVVVVIDVEVSIATFVKGIFVAILLKLSLLEALSKTVLQVLQDELEQLSHLMSIMLTIFMTFDNNRP